MTITDIKNNSNQEGNIQLKQFAFFKLSGQHFCIPTESISDVITKIKLTQIPTAPRAIKGMFNLRGRIVTVLCLRELLDVVDVENCSKENITEDLIVTNYVNELFGFEIGKLIGIKDIDVALIEQTPPNLSKRLQKNASGIYTQDDAVSVVLNIDKLLTV